MRKGKMMWMLFDLSYLSHRARYSLSNLSSEDMPTGVLYGFFEQLYSICSQPRFASNKVLIFADSRKSYRAQTFPEYKAKRASNRTDEEWQQIFAMQRQIKLLRRKILPAIGIPIFWQKGLEADDSMAWAAKELTRRGEEGVMVTGDGDLYQCITQKIAWYDPGRDLLYSPHSFQKKFHIKPDQWGLVKAIGGCSTDNVPGIRGVSEKGAIDYLLGRLPSHHKKHQTIALAMAFGEVKKWQELVVLPHQKTRPLDLHPPDYQPEAFFDFCKVNDIDSYLTDKGRRRWEGFFRGVFPGAPRRRT